MRVVQFDSKGNYIIEKTEHTQGIYDQNNLIRKMLSVLM